MSFSAIIAQLVVACFNLLGRQMSFTTRAGKVYRYCCFCLIQFIRC